MAARVIGNTAKVAYGSVRPAGSVFGKLRCGGRPPAVGLGWQEA